MRAGLVGLGRGSPRKVTGVPQLPAPIPLSFLQETVFPGSPSPEAQALLAWLLLFFCLEPRDQTLGIPSLSTSYDDTVAAPSVSCRI